MSTDPSRRDAPWDLRHGDRLRIQRILVRRDELVSRQDDAVELSNHGGSLPGYKNST